jgi:plasmid stabilization system protein ParE
MRVHWNKRALQELWAAFGWIEKENPVAADEFFDAVMNMVDLLREYPGMGKRTSQPDSRESPCSCWFTTVI